MAEAIWSCGDVVRERPPGRVSVGGRVLQARSTQLSIADATARLEVHLEDPLGAEAPAAGTWIVVSGQLDTDTLEQARLLQVFPGRFEARGEFARFAELGKTLQQVALARRAVRAFFEARGFVETVTPWVVDAPGTDPYIEPHRTERGWLITSPEFHMKRLLAGGFSRIYQLAPCARNEELGPWHQPEFTLVEWYRSFTDMQRVMHDTEELVCHVVRELTGGETIHHAGRRWALDRPFVRLSVRDAFARFAGIADACALAREDEQRYFSCLVDHVEPGLRAFDRPVFLTDYPRSQAALARAKPDDPEVAERFELYLAGVELCNGYGELVDPVEQRQRFERDAALREQKQLAELPPDEQLLRALEEGIPPCAGNALGLERLLALMLDRPLRDVLTFPR